MHLNILGKRKNQQGENERCVVCVCVCVFPPYHFGLAFVMPPNVSVCIFIHILTYFVREKREGGFGKHRKTPTSDGSQSATLSHSCELGRGKQFEVTGQIAPLQLTKRKKKKKNGASSQCQGKRWGFILHYPQICGQQMCSWSNLSLTPFAFLCLPSFGGPCIPKRACPNKQLWNISSVLRWWVFYLNVEVPSTQSALTPTLGYMPCGGLES